MKQQTLFAFSILFGVLVAADPGWGRPVSYTGGWTSMLRNNGDRNFFHVHYSPTARYSLGYKFEYWRQREYAINALQMNNLLRRWNAPDSQANLYLKSGIGSAYSNRGHFNDKFAPAIFTGLSADWEDRRFFFSYKNRYTEAGAVADFYAQSVRAGLAPYIGGYGDLHTWVMLELDHEPESEEQISVTPLLRFFKGINMAEIGFSNHGDVLFNWITVY